MESSILDSTALFIKSMLDYDSNDTSGSNHLNNKSFSYTSTYGHIFPFEREFESHEFVHSLVMWMQANWKLSFLFSAIYVCVIFTVKAVMKNRTRFELRMPLILWNLTLATFSIIGVVRVWPEFRHAIFQRGIVYSVCDTSYAYGVPGMWTFLFIMSKLPELVDTIFIVLRKQELIFLHWYHHITVLIYCWYSYNDFSASGRWFMAMNYFVHSTMYSYYALKAMKIRVPVSISKLITILQLSQMVFGCYVNWIAYRTKLNSPETNCRVTDDNIFYSFLMYLSYFLLFFKFFLDAYVKRNSKFKISKETTTGEDVKKKD